MTTHYPIQYNTIIPHFGSKKLETIYHTDHHNTIIKTYNSFIYELLQNSQHNTYIKTTKHTNSVHPHHHIHQLIFHNLFHNTIVHLKYTNNTIDTNQITNLNHWNQHFLNNLKNILIPTININLIKKINIVNLNTNQSKPLINQPQKQHHIKTLNKHINITQITPKNDNEVQQIPPHLLNNFHTDNLLSLNTQWVHKINQIDPTILNNILHNLHTTIKINVQTDDNNSINHKLHQLYQQNTSPKQKNQQQYPHNNTVHQDHHTNVPHTHTNHNTHQFSNNNHLTNNRNQNHHTQIFEWTYVNISTHLHPQIQNSQNITQILNPHQIGTTFYKTNNIIKINGKIYPFQFPPHTKTVKPLLTHIPFIEQNTPNNTTPFQQHIKIVYNIQQTITSFTPIHNFDQLIPNVTPIKTHEPHLKYHNFLSYITPQS